MELNVRDFSGAVGKSRAAVYKALKEGRLEYSSDGMIDTDDSLSISFAGSNPSNNGGRFSTSKSGGMNLGSMERSELEDERLRAQIEKLYLETKIKSGEYVSREMVVDRVIRPINDFLIRTITDLPRTTLLEAKAMIASGMSDGEAEKRLKHLYESNARKLKDVLLEALADGD